MDAEKDRQKDKPSYEKPTAVDLGPAAPVVGGSCGPGDQFDDSVPNSVCLVVGNYANLQCWAGAAIPPGCDLGFHPTTECFDGLTGVMPH